MSTLALGKETHQDLGCRLGKKFNNERDMPCFMLELIQEREMTSLQLALSFQGLKQGPWGAEGQRVVTRNDRGKKMGQGQKMRDNWEPGLGAQRGWEHGGAGSTAGVGARRGWEHGGAGPGESC